VVLSFVREAGFDRSPAYALGLDLEQAQAGVEIGPRADLEAAPSAQRREAEADQVGGVEVDRGVAEEPAAADVEDPGVAAEAGQQGGQLGEGQDVFAVAPDLELGLGGELGQADRSEPVQTGQRIGHGRGGGHGRAPAGTTRRLEPAAERARCE
jgi:hypothetical protein